MNTAAIAALCLAWAVIGASLAILAINWTGHLCP